MTDTNEIPSASQGSRDDLHLRPRAVVEHTARKWFEIATDMRTIRDELAADLETALNVCQDYQRILAMMDIPDPNLYEVRRLLTKYRMTWTEPKDRSYAIWLDGKDITVYPDSIEGDVIETIELVQDSEGELHCRPPKQLGSGDE